jgi:hypothetical protein
LATPDILSLRVGMHVCDVLPNLTVFMLACGDRPGHLDALTIIRLRDCDLRLDDLCGVDADRQQIVGAPLVLRGIEWFEEIRHDQFLMFDFSFLD